MNIIFATLIAIIIILLLIIFATWLDKFGRKQKVELIEKVIDRVSSLVSSKISLVTDLQKAGFDWKIEKGEENVLGSYKYILKETITK